MLAHARQGRMGSNSKTSLLSMSKLHRSADTSRHALLGVSACHPTYRSYSRAWRSYAVHTSALKYSTPILTLTCPESLRQTSPSKGEKSGTPGTRESRVPRGVSYRVEAQSTSFDARSRSNPLICPLNSRPHRTILHEGPRLRRKVETINRSSCQPVAALTFRHLAPALLSTERRFPISRHSVRARGASSICSTKGRFSRCQSAVAFTTSTSRLTITGYSSLSHRHFPEERKQSGSFSTIDISNTCPPQTVNEMVTSSQQQLH